MKKINKKMWSLILSGALAAGMFSAVPVTADAGTDTEFEFTMEDIEGEEYTEEIFGEARLTLVNVFATWCGPCVQEIPELQKLSEEMKDEEVQVIGIVMDTGSLEKPDEDAVEAAKLLAELTEAEYPFLIPDEGMMNDRLSGIQAYPETFFVNEEGKIVGETYVGSRDMDAWKEIVEKELEALEKE